MTIASPQIEPTQTPRSTSQPIRKVGFASFAGALVILTVSILNDHVSYFKNNPISGNIAAAATAVLEFIVAYTVPPGKDEMIVEEDGKRKSAKND